MRVLDILPGTSVDGPGMRTSVYFAGCTLHCEGCHNPQSWDPAGGREMTADELFAILSAEGFDVTFTGGDPMLQAAELAPLAARLKSEGYGVWCYTGRLYSDCEADETMRSLLDNIDVLVDGPYIAALRNRSLLFRGSSNQRLVDVATSRAEGKVVEWSSPF